MNSTVCHKKIKTFSKVRKKVILFLCRCWGNTGQRSGLSKRLDDLKNFIVIS